MAQPQQVMAPSRAHRGKRIVLTAIGSLGDLHPIIAIAIGLKARGHDVVLATGECYRRKVDALGLGFRPLRPDSDFVTDPAAMRRIMDFRWGTIRVLRELILPILRETYEDTVAAVDGGADLLVAHPLTFATRLVAEKQGIPWASAQISPVCLASVFDLPASLSFLTSRTNSASWARTSGDRCARSLTWATRAWAKPIVRLRSELGLPQATDNPLVDGCSPTLVLALFSKLLAARQVDWPPQTIQTGFPFYDQDGEVGLPLELARFLDDGPPPVVFTLGVTAAMVAGPFFESSIAAAVKMGHRAVLIGDKNRQKLPASLPNGVAAFDYAPFSQLFARASVVVHAGGIGTTGLAMRSGRPMLVVPHAHDQPDNAAQLARLGIARTISRRRYTSTHVVTELGRLIGDPTFARRASKVRRQMEDEDGVRTACDALEAMIQRSPATAAAIG